MNEIIITLHSVRWVIKPYMQHQILYGKVGKVEGMASKRAQLRGLFHFSTT